MGDWLLHELDVCECGDYRHQHHDDGRCPFPRCCPSGYRQHRVETRPYPCTGWPGVRCKHEIAAYADDHASAAPANRKH